MLRIDKVKGSLSSLRLREEIKQNDRAASSFYQMVDGDRNVGGVSVSSPRYAFALKRGKSDSAWLLDKLDTQNKEGVFETGKSVRATVNEWLLSHFDIYDRSLPSLVRQPTFKITQASQVPRGGRALVRVDFDCPQPLSVRPFSPVQGGWIILDPERYWCLRECEVRCRWASPRGGTTTGTMKVIFEFQDEVNPFPILKRSVRTLKMDAKEDRDAEETFEFELREPNDLPSDEEFTLTAYGLPEPVGMPTPGRSRAYLWFALAGAAALALGILFAWAVRRRRAATTVPSSER